MEALVVFLAVIVGLLGFDLAALRWGVDSRSAMPDDHRR
jgi:hypothetical protein